MDGGSNLDRKNIFKQEREIFLNIKKTTVSLFSLSLLLSVVIV